MPINVMCSCPDEKTQQVLKLVCDLYALDRIWTDIGTYRNVDYVAPNKAKVCACHSYTATSQGTELSILFHHCFVSVFGSCGFHL
jgi:hypothetical protein